MITRPQTAGSALPPAKRRRPLPSSARSAPALAGGERHTPLPSHTPSLSADSHPSDGPVSALGYKHQLELSSNTSEASLTAPTTTGEEVDEREFVPAAAANVTQLTGQSGEAESGSDDGAGSQRSSTPSPSPPPFVAPSGPPFPPRAFDQLVRLAQAQCLQPPTPMDHAPTMSEGESSTQSSLSAHQMLSAAYRDLFQRYLDLEVDMTALRLEFNYFKVETQRLLDLERQQSKPIHQLWDLFSQFAREATDLADEETMGPTTGLALEPSRPAIAAGGGEGGVRGQPGGAQRSQRRQFVGVWSALLSPDDEPIKVEDCECEGLPREG